MEPNSVLELEPRLNAFIHSLTVFDHLLLLLLLLLLSRFSCVLYIYWNDQNLEH